MGVANLYMNKTNMTGEVFRSNRFRTPAGSELEIGVWVDRIGEHRDFLPPNGNAPAFRLLGLYAAVEVVSGRGFFQVKGREPLGVEAGTVFFVRPQEPCRYWPEGEWLQRFAVWGGPEAERLSDLLMPSSSPVFAAPGAVSRVCERLSALMDKDGPLAALERRIVLERLLCELLSDAASGVSLSSLPPSLRRALALISMKDGDLSLASAAKAAGLSGTHLRRLFKARLGLSPKDYAMSLRLNKAKELLSQGAEIKDVSARCGFSDVFHFMRSFKRRVGVTAGSYAKASGLCGALN